MRWPGENQPLSLLTVCLMLTLDKTGGCFSLAYSVPELHVEEQGTDPAGAPERERHREEKKKLICSVAKITDREPQSPIEMTLIK